MIERKGHQTLGQDLFFMVSMILCCVFSNTIWENYVLVSNLMAGIACELFSVNILMEHSETTAKLTLFIPTERKRPPDARTGLDGFGKRLLHVS
jgi:hypothetical protein